MKIFEIISDAPRSFLAGVKALFAGNTVPAAGYVDAVHAGKPRGFRMLPTQHPCTSVRWSFLDPLTI